MIPSLDAVLGPDVTHDRRRLQILLLTDGRAGIAALARFPRRDQHQDIQNTLSAPSDLLEAHVIVTIAGTVYGTYTVPAGGSYNISYAAACPGPVIAESDVPIMATQRIIGWSSFEETLGAQWT